MMKKTSSRNQRTSRGIKGKHVLQICVLLGVCVWLIYQVKYSHDKKKEFYEKDVEASTLSRNEDMMKLGRKDLPHVQEVAKEEKPEEEEDEDVESDEVIRRGDEEEKQTESKHKAANEHHGEEEKEEEEEEEVEEEEEEKNKKVGGEDEVDDEENKHGEEQELEYDDKQGGGDVEDDSDEQDQDKPGEIDGDEGFFEEEKEREGDNGEKENESNRKDEDNSQDEIDKTVHEAREEHYKADDASSAVSQETQLVNSENERSSSGNSETNVAGVTIEQENKSNNSGEFKIEPHKSLLKLGETEGGNLVNTTNTEEKEHESGSSSSVMRRETRSDEHPEANSTATERKVETDNGNSVVTELEASVLVQNGTESTSNQTQARNETEAAAVPTVASSLQNIELNQSHDSNTTIFADTENKDSVEDRFVNSTSESGLLEKLTGSNSTELKGNSVSLTQNKEDRRANGESGSEEISDRLLTKYKIDAAEEEKVDSSVTTISHEERAALTDPDTLPDIRTEGTGNEEIAAE